MNTDSLHPCRHERGAVRMPDHREPCSVCAARYEHDEDCPHRWRLDAFRAGDDLHLVPVPPSSQRRMRAYQAVLSGVAVWSVAMLAAGIAYPLARAVCPGPGSALALAGLVGLLGFAAIGAAVWRR